MCASRGRNASPPRGKCDDVVCPWPTVFTGRDPPDRFTIEDFFVEGSSVPKSGIEHAEVGESRAPKSVKFTERVQVGAVAAGTHVCSRKCGQYEFKAVWGLGVRHVL